jgi:hypothetical protein
VRDLHPAVSIPCPSAGKVPVHPVATVWAGEFGSVGRWGEGKAEGTGLTGAFSGPRDGRSGSPWSERQRVPAITAPLCPSRLSPEGFVLRV